MKRETLRRAMNALALLLLVAMSAPANARSYSDVGCKEQAASLRRALQSWDTSEDVAEDKYLVTFRDLNNDGKEEAVAYVVGTDWCGSGGCVTLVLKRNGVSWKVVADIVTTKLPIRVLADTSHGWHSLGVWVQGGGVNPGHEVKLKFDGKTYPSGPSIPPAVKIKGAVGEILIPDNVEAAIPID